ncbi:MAG: helix-turn-helix domain-containing protein [Candidatus Hydrothermarchaeales archaeon]
MKRNKEKLKRWMIRRKLEGWSVRKICGHAGVSRDMFYRWWRRYHESGWEGLKERSKAPNTAYRTPSKTVEEVIRLRREKNWGPNKIEGYLRKKQDRVKPVGHNTIYRIICDAGLNHPLDKPRKSWGKRRFEREHSNSLWQADFKLAEDDNWMITYLDDHSRFVLGSEKFYDPTANNALQLLEECLGRYGRPEQILTDRGTQFYPARKKAEKETLSRFTRCCRELGIDHIVASKRRPTTIGKVEAFHKAYVFEAWMFECLGNFVHYWNFERPHQALKYLYPADVYFRDLKV